MKSSILAVLLMSSLGLASVQTQVNQCSGGATCGGSQTSKQKGGRRDLSSLFQRDPETDFAMKVFGKNMPSYY